jgi:hypothetical protein
MGNNGTKEGYSTIIIHSNFGSFDAKVLATANVRIVKLDITKPREGLVLGASPSMDTITCAFPRSEIMNAGGGGRASLPKHASCPDE